PELTKLRSETGRPHWIVLDEAHHCLPAKWEPAPVTLPQGLPSCIAVTVHPDEVAGDFLKLVSTVIGIGEGAFAAVRRFCEASGMTFPGFPAQSLAADQISVLHAGVMEIVARVNPKQKRQRHVRKYALGELGEDK